MKKLTSLILAIVMLFAVTIPVFATSNSTSFTSVQEEEYTYCADNYTKYTIDLTQIRGGELSYASDANTVDTTIDFVKSLDLKSMGYSHIEEACMNELNFYKENDMVLEKYTVLVPKTREMYFYATYLGYDYYYEYTSESQIRRETEGAEKGASNETLWNNWIMGLIDLIVSFALEDVWSVAYSAVTSVTNVFGASDVHYGSFNEYVEQFTNVTTRTIYKQRSANVLDPCYQDQRCFLRVNMYFCPIGTAFDSDYIFIRTLRDGFFVANDASQEEILQAANVHSNHDSMVIHSVGSYRVREDWGD